MSDRIHNTSPPLPACPPETRDRQENTPYETPEPKEPQSEMSEPTEPKPASEMTSEVIKTTRVISETSANLIPPALVILITVIWAGIYESSSPESYQDGLNGLSSSIFRASAGLDFLALVVLVTVNQISGSSRLLALNSATHQLRRFLCWTISVAGLLVIIAFDLLGVVAIGVLLQPGKLTTVSGMGIVLIGLACCFSTALAVISVTMWTRTLERSSFREA